MKKILFLTTLVLFCIGAGRTWYWATDGFRLSRIEGFERTGKERELSEEAKSALSQRYIYFGRGRQCFAFESEDGQYVIKFPRLDRYRDRLWTHAPFMDSFYKKYQKNHASRKKKLFNSFEISYDELQEDTAIVAMFNSPQSGKEIELVDRIGREFRLPIEKTGFILQRKKELFKDVFQKAVVKGNKAEIDSILDRLLGVVVQIAKKGILSKDGSFLKNFGFDQKRAYQIDIGSFYRDPGLSARAAYEESIHASVETLRVWLLHLDPILLKLIDEKLQPIYESAI